MKLLLGKHELAYENTTAQKCSIERLTKQIDSVLPTFKSWTVHEGIFNVRTIV